jgi:hypothetical protein
MTGDADGIDNAATMAELAAAAAAAAAALMGGGDAAVCLVASAVGDAMKEEVFEALDCGDEGWGNRCPWRRGETNG